MGFIPLHCRGDPKGLRAPTRNFEEPLGFCCGKPPFVGARHCLALGDAVRRPYSGVFCGFPGNRGLSKRRQRRMYPNLDGHRVLFRHGMISDDTEHACTTAQALIASGGDPHRFARSLAWRLRFWLLGIPAGIGLATAAILGGIAGARAGRAGIPREWLGGLWEWPRSAAWMERLGRRLAEVAADRRPRPPLPLPVWGLLPRNLFFLAVVLAHGFRRLLPPY